MTDGPDALFGRYRRQAVLLHRPWPPHAGPPTNSRFGGLPRLPEDHAWPRTSSGTPLHFLAQVDCADIRVRTALPDRGVLFFFGRDDVRRTWSAAPPASDHCRVLFAPDATAHTPPRQPPADLPPLTRPWTHPDNVHPAWPVVPLAFDSVPEEAALPEAAEQEERGWGRLAGGGADGEGVEAATREAYGEQLGARRAAALVAATGVQPPGGPMTAWTAADAGRAILEFAARGPDSFPQHWAYVHHLARAVLDRPLFYASAGATPEQRTAEAERWLARARAVPLDQPVAQDDRQALRTWVANLGHPELAYRAAAGTIRSWAGDAALAARVPDPVYAACARGFYGYHAQHPQFSQMLGHAPATHLARAVDDPMVCLLSLDADLALGWHFADGGQCTFWMTPDDLARRDFGNVVGTVDGG